LEFDNNCGTMPNRITKVQECDATKAQDRCTANQITRTLFFQSDCDKKCFSNLSSPTGGQGAVAFTEAPFAGRHLNELK